MEAVTKKPNVPALRFPEFSGEWGKSRLGDVAELVSGVALPSEDILESGKWLIARGINVKSGFVERSAELDRYTDSPVAGKFIVSEGDVLVPMDGSKLGKNVAMADVGLDGAVLIQRVARIRAYRGVCSNKYLFQLLFNWRFERHVFRVNTSSAIPHISIEELKNYQIPLGRLAEQEKVAAFLTVVDERFGLLKRKKELLEEYKKGVMQRLFSREIRFKDEEGNEYPEWEEKRLGEVVDEFMVPMRDKPENLTGPIPWCRVEDFDGIYLSQSKSGQGVDEKTIDAMNLVVFPENSLIVSCSANLGFAAIVATPLVTNQTFIGLVPNPQLLDVKFFYYMMTRAARELNVLASGTTIKYLSKDGFKKFKRVLPSIREQKAIAGCLMDVDFVIRCVVKQIQQSQGFKEGLLQKMFV